MMQTDAAMNGRPRDQISTDIKDGRPTISPAGDFLALRVVALLSWREADKLFENLERRIRRSPSYVEWAGAPTDYLSELDPRTASSIETALGALHRRMVRRAKARGW